MVVHVTVGSAKAVKLPRDATVRDALPILDTDFKPDLIVYGIDTEDRPHHPEILRFEDYAALWEEVNAERQKVREAGRARN